MPNREDPGCLRIAKNCAEIILATFRKCSRTKVVILIIRTEYLELLINCVNSRNNSFLIHNASVDSEMHNKTKANITALLSSSKVEIRDSTNKVKSYS